jgi:hypothetical protein
VTYETCNAPECWCAAVSITAPLNTPNCTQADTVTITIEEYILVFPSYRPGVLSLELSKHNKDTPSNLNCPWKKILIECVEEILSPLQKTRKFRVRF